MTVTFRPATRPNTPLIVGIAGPTKSGKTYSAHLIARGLAGGQPVLMLNAEGAKGHQYADTFEYSAAELQPPYRPAKYTEALKAALELQPGVVIIDSVSHMHDGPGGMLDYHQDELKRLGGNDRMNFTAWVKPKHEENEFIYTLLDAGAHIILCFRAKPKLKIVRGKDPEDLGYQPIASDRISFETMFTLMLPPGCKGVPDLETSQMREAFEPMVKKGKPIDSDLGVALLEWSAGATQVATIVRAQQENLGNIIRAKSIPLEQAQQIIYDAAGVTTRAQIAAEHYDAVVAALTAVEAPTADGEQDPGPVQNEFAV